MSQKASRKGVVNEEKEKTDTPVKEMKKKMAANAEKEKQTAEKKETEKSADKPAEKNDKAADKPEKNDKAADKPEKSADKKSEKSAEKKAEKKADDPVEKKEESNKDDKSGKSHSGDQKKPSERPKQNGRESRGVNGTANGEENGTVSAADDDDDDDAMVIDEGEHDDMFPELTYDDTSDAEFEPPTPDAAGSRSFTRRSQSKDSKVLKLKEDAPPATDRKLRSADSPKPQDKKEKLQEKKAQESPKKDGKESETKEQEEKENGGKTEKAEADVVIEIDGGDEEPRKTDTNYSKSRVKVSPYRRSVRLADQTVSSMQANYTGNNTTMEMDITETTSSYLSEEASLDDSSYLSGLRSIRGRRSYKPLKEMALRHVANKTIPRAVNVSTSEQPSRPTAPVVGRKRKPEADDSVELGAEAGSSLPAHAHTHGKRARLLARLSQSLRRAASTPLPARRAAEIVGINTDLPLSAPVAQTGAFDPEALKPAEAPAAVPLAPAQPLPDGDRDNRRCVVM